MYSQALKKFSSIFGSNLRNLDLFLFRLCARRNVEHVFGLERHLLSLMNLILTFLKKKKKNFRHCWVQIREILVISLSDSVLAEMLSTFSDWSAICSLLWTQPWPFKKSHLVSISRMRFTTSVPSGASTPSWVYCIRDRHICTPNLISFYFEWSSLLGNLN